MSENAPSQSASSANYDPNAIEARWQATWEAQRPYAAANPGEPGSEKPPFYILDFFPYPSGAGLHVGHPLGYIASDIVSRFMRARGFNVLHPMGWDAFGLPAEQYAVETGIHPRETTAKNISTYKRQLTMLGLGYDWQRELSTTDPDYYRWTQWIFLQIYNSWYDPEHRWTDAAGREVIGSARPIEHLPIPDEVANRGEIEVARFRDDHRLAYLAEVPVNWCPALGTVLSNEEVTSDGRSERGDHPVFRRPMKQWMLRITEYADRLLADLEPLDWPEPIKLMQRNWIGRSVGAYVDFALELEIDHEHPIIRVFTTRPDTLYGATYMVLAPEHRLVQHITTPEQRDTVEAYVTQARNRSDLERTAGSKEKTGVFTGAYAINPVTRNRIPIWVADYVLIGYGTGSIMAVPGHDTRDYEFAETFDLPIVQVVQPQDDSDWRGFTHDGLAVNSPTDDTRFEGQADLNGQSTPEAKCTIIDWLETNQCGEGTTQYKLRDWLFSRQRYWGEPFPIAYDDRGLAHMIPEEQLPVALPEMEDFRPSASDDPHAEPQTPLSRASDFATLDLEGQQLRRELNTMPQWAGSCWYYLRFCDPNNTGYAIGKDVENYWLGGKLHSGEHKFGGVDLYMGGAEHAVLHLLYARFWHKMLYDLRHLSTPEPFQKLFNQGMIQSYAFQREDGPTVARDRVIKLLGSDAESAALAPLSEDETPNTAAFEQWTENGRKLSDDALKKLRSKHELLLHADSGVAVSEIVAKMSKSLKNVVNPDLIVADYGADTLRLYEMSMGPLDASKPWNTRDIVGPHRFLQRLWRLVVSPVDDENPEAGWQLNPKLVDDRPAALERALHKTIAKVTDDIPRFALNTAVSQMIVWVNEAVKAEAVGKDQVSRFLQVLAPFAPHLCEELFARLGHEQLIVRAPWPEYDPALVKDDELEIAVQVKGKVRARITVPADADEETLIAAAKDAPGVQKDIAGKEIRKAIVVKGRLINLIV